MTEHWNLILYVFISVCIMHNLHTHTCISIDSRILRDQEAVASVPYVVQAFTRDYVANEAVNDDNIKIGALAL